MANKLAINPKTIYGELQRLKPQIEAALPKHMTPDRMARLAYTQLRVNPALFNCTFESFMACIMGAAQMGLEPGINGQCYLIPYRDNKKDTTVCTLIPGWKGLIDLVSRSGRATAWTSAVRKDDGFNFKLGSSPRLEHEPGDEDTGDFTHVYAVGWVKDAQWPIIEVWSRAKVLKHLSQYNKVGDRHYALTNENNLEMYGRKCALLQVIKYLPTSIELRDAVTLETEALEGKQKLTIDGVLTTGGLVADGPDEQSLEAEGIMQVLDWPPEKREMFRSNYENRISDGLAYLKSEIQKQGRQSSEPKKEIAQGDQPKEQPQGQNASHPQSTTRRRGGAPKAMAEQTQEGDTAGTTETTPSETSTSTSEEPTTEPTDSLFNGKPAEPVKKEWF